MKKRILSSILCLLMIAGCVNFVFADGAAAQITVQDYEPKVSGSFVQSWFAYSWGEARWEKEMTAYNEAGIEYLILGDVAGKNAGGQWSYFYPSKVEELKSGTYNGDVIDKALRSAKKHGIKVFLGMGGDDGWWDSGASQRYLDYCDVSAKIAKDVYAQYYSDNQDAFGGFYYVPEIFNDAKIMSGKNADNLINGLNVIMAAVEEVSDNVPVMFSPFYNQAGYYLNLTETENFYKKFFTEVNFRNFDIFAPQDAVGAGWVKINNVENVYKMYKKAVDYASAQGSPIKFWANCEDFMQVKQAGDSYAFHTADLNKFVKQMTIASKYCERIITFAYSHYYSPNNINPAWHNAYVKYASTGETSTTPPSDIEKLSVKNDGGSFNLEWTGSETDTAISRYAIRYNGDLCDYIVARRYDGGGAIDKIVTKYTIRGHELPIDDEKFEISVTPYDIYGNKGNPIAYTISKGNLSNDVIISTEDKYVPVEMKEEYLPWYDFDFWNDGDSTIGTSKDKNNYLLERISGNFKISATSKNSFRGNAMQITSRSSGAFDGIAINAINTKNPQWDTEYEKSKYLTMYVDTTNRNEPLRMWVIFYDDENINNASGKNSVTSFAPIDGSTSFMEVDGKLQEVTNSDQSITIPAGYKGRIFMPLDTNTFAPIWGSENINGKIDLKKLPTLRLSFDNVGSDGSSFIIDEIGFMRDYDAAPVYEKGDVNGDGKINALDSLNILKSICGIKKLTSANIKAADFNSDGGMDTRDSLGILKYLVS